MDVTVREMSALTFHDPATVFAILDESGEPLLDESGVWLVDDERVAVTFRESTRLTFRETE